MALAELDEFRMKTGAKKVEQLRDTGATVLACPCENCRLQITGLNERFELGLQVTPLMDLVVKAMGFPPQDA